MEKFTAWMEKHFVPIAAKIGSQKHLVAIRDGFIGIMPITMAGAVATLLTYSSVICQTIICRTGILQKHSSG